MGSRAIHFNGCTYGTPLYSGACELYDGLALIGPSAMVKSKLRMNTAVALESMSFWKVNILNTKWLLPWPSENREAIVVKLDRICYCDVLPDSTISPHNFHFVWRCVHLQQNSRCMYFFQIQYGFSVPCVSHVYLRYMISLSACLPFFHFFLTCVLLNYIAISLYLFPFSKRFWRFKKHRDYYTEVP